MEPKDSKAVFKLLNSHLSKYKLNIQFTLEEVSHFLLPREWVIESFVVEDSNKVITDFVSFYSLPSSVLKHPEHKILNVAYSYYNVPGRFNMTELMKDALILARNKGYDVFNALDVQENLEVMKELNFGVGDGNLHYYLYNWRIQGIEAQDCGMVLV
jgi:glycylpeptide N-tetradecanoyltransferase